VKAGPSRGPAARLKDPDLPLNAAEVRELRKQAGNQAFTRAYRGLLAFMARLRAQLQAAHPRYRTSDVYQGYFDITHFAVIPPGLGRHRLKIAVVFNYDAFQFELWLCGVNRGVQRKYYERLRAGSWPACRVREPGPGVDAVLECDVASGSALADPEALTSTIDERLMQLTRDVEAFLSRESA
jgi:hypothetical protein